MKSYKDLEIYQPLTKLINEYNILGKKINKFIQYVEESWLTSNQKQVTKS